MPGGARSMKGEKQMIYKNITFKADPFSYNLEFDDRITLVGGNSGTGKTVLYEMLEDLRLTNEYKAIKLFNYKYPDYQPHSQTKYNTYRPLSYLSLPMHPISPDCFLYFRPQVQH